MFVLVGHWSSPKTLEAGWPNAMTSQPEHNITRQVAISARNPSDTKSWLRMGHLPLAEGGWSEFIKDFGIGFCSREASGPLSMGRGIEGTKDRQAGRPKKPTGSKHLARVRNRV